MMPVPSGGSAFFPPSMPSFWNQPYCQQQQQMTNNIPVSSPLPFFNPGALQYPFQQLQAAAAAVHQAAVNGQNGMNSPATAPSPTFPSCIPTPSPPLGAGPGEILTGTGKLNWLSSQAGLIRSDMGVISFQLKEFCDQAVNDLTLVLRPGFILKFQALAAPGLNYSVDGQAQWVATFVAPVHGPEAKQLANGEVNLEAPAGVETGPPHLTKEPYFMELESKAVPMLLSIFERNGLPQCQLGNFHCHISNCGDEELYRYVGTSSLKRRQFLERRTHLFDINSHDLVSLQPAAIYITVVTLAKQLLIRGGACLMQELFDHFGSCPDIPLEARDMIGEGKNHFLRFLQAHPWIFTVFPSRVFVSVRRNLPNFDYAAFISENFPDYELRNSSPTNGFVSGPPAPPRAMPLSTPGWPTDEPHIHHQQLATPTFANGAISSSGIGSTANSSYGSGSNLSMASVDTGQTIFGTGYMTNGHQGVMSSAPGTPRWGLLSPPLEDLFPSRPNGGSIAPIGVLPTEHMRPANQPTPPQHQQTANFWGVGGRIKRFVDMETQTDGPGGLKTDACVQTMVEMKSTGCGPEDEPVNEAITDNDGTSLNDESTSSSDNQSSSGSIALDQQSLFGPFASGFEQQQVEDHRFGFNPMFDGPLSIGGFGIGIAGLKNLSLDG